MRDLKKSGVKAKYGLAALIGILHEVLGLCACVNAVGPLVATCGLHKRLQSPKSRHSGGESLSGEVVGNGDYDENSQVFKVLGVEW